MLAFRNKRFLDKLAGEFLKGRVFVAVDADQIPGEAGLIRMFRDAGLNVQRISSPEKWNEGEFRT